MFHVIIPARYGSSRLPGKPLALIGDKPMIQIVYENAIKSGAMSVAVATDDHRIADTVRAIGGDAYITPSEAPSGTERVAMTARMMGLSRDDIIVNLQGDEPFMPPSEIRIVAESALMTQECDMSTLYSRIEEESDLFNPNVVKVVTDSRGFAMYFSRAPIPWYRDGFVSKKIDKRTLSSYKKHIGIYAFRSAFLDRYTSFHDCAQGELESLEQLKALYWGAKIYVAESKCANFHGIDTQKDLDLANQIIRAT